MKKLRIYIDTSVIGGYYDEEFKHPTRELFELFREGIFIPVISDHVLTELNNGAPKEVIRNLDTIDYELKNVTDEMRKLFHKYTVEKIINERYNSDALHIAIATVLNVDVLVSWNFKHIVNYNKIRLFNSINIHEGYDILDIKTPQEVIEYDE